MLRPKYQKNAADVIHLASALDREKRLVSMCMVYYEYAYGPPKWVTERYQFEKGEFNTMTQHQTSVCLSRALNRQLEGRVAEETTLVVRSTDFGIHWWVGKPKQRRLQLNVDLKKLVFEGVGDEIFKGLANTKLDRIALAKVQETLRDKKHPTLHFKGTLDEKGRFDYSHIEPSELPEIGGVITGVM